MSLISVMSVYHQVHVQQTAHIRDSNSWRGPSIPADLADRRVELTGPVDAKMLINALNSPAQVFMADFEVCAWKSGTRAVVLTFLLSGS